MPHQYARHMRCRWQPLPRQLKISHVTGMQTWRTVSWWV